MNGGGNNGRASIVELSLSDETIHTANLLYLTDLMHEKLAALYGIRVRIIHVLKEGKEPADDLAQVDSLIKEIKKLVAMAESACDKLSDPVLKGGMQSFLKKTGEMLAAIRMSFPQARLDRLVERSKSTAAPGAESNFVKGPGKNSSGQNTRQPMKR